MSNDDMRVMLEECMARLVGLSAALRNLDTADREYFAEYGAEHLEGCPEDDTCECPLIVACNEAYSNLAREGELAARRIDKIENVLAEHFSTNSNQDEAGASDGQG